MTPRTNTQVLERAMQRRPGELVSHVDAAAAVSTGREETEAYRIDPRDPWLDLRMATSLPGQDHMATSRMAAARADHGAVAAFDMLRTRMLQGLRANGWHRVVVTSPTRGCGKSFVTASLAVSLSKMPECRTVALDLDLHAARLGAELGVLPEGRIADWLAGAVPTEKHLVRIGGMLALGLNAVPEPNAFDRLQQDSTGHALQSMNTLLRPDVVLCDLPPMLACDDVMAILPWVDGVLLVVDATRTRAEEITQCEAQLRGQVPLLGVVLNKVVHGGAAQYGRPGVWHGGEATPHPAA